MAFAQRSRKDYTSVICCNQFSGRLLVMLVAVATLNTPVSRLPRGDNNNTITARPEEQMYLTLS